MTASALYVGRVVHRRFRPVEHSFRYRVFSLLLDLDDLPALDRSLRLFSRNRFNLFSFRDADHGDGSGNDLKSWVLEQLARRGINLEGGSVRLLCFPRLLGYVFNPLAIFYCHDAAGRLVAVLHQVTNTFHDRHSYLIPVDQADQDKSVIHQSCNKGFYVSPFIDIAGHYDFRLRRPDDQLSVAITHVQDGEPLLFAGQTGRRVPLRDGALLRVFLTHPLMTLKVMAGIHFEAFRLWRRRVPFFSRVPAPVAPVSSPARMMPAKSAETH